MIPRSVVLFFAMTFGAAAVAFASPPAPIYEFINGQWWDGSSFKARTVFGGADGRLSDRRPKAVDEIIDLHRGFVIPPLAEGHNHWLEPAAVDQYNACYLADGVFYVKDMGNIPLLIRQFRDRVNSSTSVDLVSAMTPFTGPGAHPVEIVDQFVQFGVLPKEWKADYDRQAEFVVRTQQDIDDRFPELLSQNPAYVKVFLLFSEEYAARLNDPTKYGNHRGMDPALLPHLVKLAHAAHLRVEAHIYTAADFRTAVQAGVDEIAHLPANGANAEPEMSFARFLLTPEDAKLAARRHVTVTTTLDWLADMKTEWAKRLTEQVIVPNLRLLKQNGVPILVGSDHFRRSSLGEVMELRDLKVFSNVELLNMATNLTTQSIFPDRLIGRLANNYESNFLVLERNPIDNLDNLKTITMRIKEGRRLTVPASALARSSLDCVQ